MGDKVRLAFEARLAKLQTPPDHDLPPNEADLQAASDAPHSRIDKSVRTTPKDLLA